MGATRVVPSRSVLYPTGDPNINEEEEYKLREHLVRTALRIVGTEIKEPTVVDITSAPSV